VLSAADLETTCKAAFPPTAAPTSAVPLTTQQTTRVQQTTVAPESTVSSAPTAKESSSSLSPSAVTDYQSTTVLATVHADAGSATLDAVGTDEATTKVETTSTTTAQVKIVADKPSTSPTAKPTIEQTPAPSQKPSDGPTAVAPLPTVSTASGYLIDRFCLGRQLDDPSWLSPDGIDVLHQPDLATGWCMYYIPMCRDSGYALVADGDGTGEYEVVAVFPRDSSANKAVLNWFETYLIDEDHANTVRGIKASVTGYAKEIDFYGRAVPEFSEAHIVVTPPPTTTSTTRTTKKRTGDGDKGGDGD